MSAAKHSPDLDLARDVALARTRALELEGDHALDLARALHRARALALDLDRALHRARALALDLDRRARLRVFGLQQQRACHVAPSAGRLLTAAARLLPGPYRARYAEEYRSELWEIACAGAGRRQQLRYAVRQLTRVAHLRGAVLTPKRRNAAP